MVKTCICIKCGKDCGSNRNLQIHLSKKIPCIEIPCIENITLIIEEEPITQDIEYEYMFLYNKIHNFKKLHKSNIRQGLPIWMQLMRDVNNDFRASYEMYYFKRYSWTPTIALCLIQLKNKHIEKRDDVWCKYNESFNINHFNRMMSIKHAHLMTDVRDYYGYAKF